MRLRISLILHLGLSSQKVCWTLLTSRVSVQLLLVVILCIVDFKELNSSGNFIVWVPFLLEIPLDFCVSAKFSLLWTKWRFCTVCPHLDLADSKLWDYGSGKRYQGSRPRILAKVHMKLATPQQSWSAPYKLSCNPQPQCLSIRWHSPLWRRPNLCK